MPSRYALEACYIGQSHMQHAGEERENMRPCPIHIHRWSPSMPRSLPCLPPLHHQPAPAAHRFPRPRLRTHAHTLHTHTGARPPCSYMRQGHRIAAAAAAASTRLLVLCLLLAAPASARLPTSSGTCVCLVLPQTPVFLSLRLYCHMKQGMLIGLLLRRGLRNCLSSFVAWTRNLIYFSHKATSPPHTSTQLF